MDDLSSVEWTAPKPASHSHPPGTGNYSSFPSLRPTPPVSGRSTPSNVPSGQKAPPSPGFQRSGGSTPANDSFANLVTFNASQTQSSKNLSLQEQQRLRDEERRKQEFEKRKAFDAHFGSGNTQGAGPWDSLGDGRTTPNRITSPPTYAATKEYGGQKLSQVINKPFANIPREPAGVNADQGEDDVLAAFNSAAPVDKSSHMEPVSREISDESAGSRIEGDRRMNSRLDNTNGSRGSNDKKTDDDPFGLGMNGYQHPPDRKIAPSANLANDDDVLGLLGRPVSEFPKQVESKPKPLGSDHDARSESEPHPQARAVADLVDMGFAPEKATRALETTNSGTDVQAAIAWLLHQAHEESRKGNQSQPNSVSQNSTSRTTQSRRTPGRRKSSTSSATKVAWMREQTHSNSQPNRPDNRSAAIGENDHAQYASDMSSKMFKTANSLWKTGTKKINQAVADLNSDVDSRQPKWMKESQDEARTQNSRNLQRESDGNGQRWTERRPRPQSQAPTAEVTDEALMLEAAVRPPPHKSRIKPDALQETSDFPGVLPQHPVRRLEEQIIPKPKFMQQVPARDPRAKLSRQAVEEETSQAYISPVRRKKSTPTPTSTESAPEPDLLFSDSTPLSRPIATASQPKPAPVQPQVRSRPAPSPSRLPAHARVIPSLSSFSQRASTESRHLGTQAFKRGDYAQATSHYTTSLSALPANHPLTIPLHSNRALSHLKTGDPKAAITDATAALAIIGPACGAGEIIDLGGSEGIKQMSAYWEKSMMRQAEALEQLERWTEAAATWRSCVEAGVGGATSIAGRNRCEKVAQPPNPTTVAPKRRIVKPRPKPSTLGDMAPDSESVTRLRAANAAADKLDDEKFKLADVVDGRISRWRAGKEGNLRALLSTLETVLWEGSGWKKIGMGDVLLPGKVKVVYMKGIAKVHPDKVSWFLPLF